MSAKLTQEEWINRFHDKHGDFYDYSLMNYIRKDDKVCIICPIHNEFWQTPSNHANYGCRQCSIENKRKTQETFLDEAYTQHGNTYDYSKVQYVRTNDPVCIICFIHGEFWQTPILHITGSGCPKCSDKIRKHGPHLTTEQFIEKAILHPKHGNKYDYSLVEYQGAKEKVIIICPMHGQFKVTPNGHLNGDGCPKCGREIVKNILLKPQDEWIIDAQEIHGYGTYDYSLVEYKGKNIPVKIICSIHGIFTRKPSDHIWQQAGCPKCFNCRSKGEDEWALCLGAPDDCRGATLKIKDAISPITQIITEKKLFYPDILFKKLALTLEFDGDWWHGNPEVFDLSKKFDENTTLLDKYNQTLRKCEIIISWGFRVISIWENDWNKIKNDNLLIQKMKLYINYWIENSEEYHLQITKELLNDFNCDINQECIMIWNKI